MPEKQRWLRELAYAGGEMVSQQTIGISITESDLLDLFDIV
jgi:hypothetical protein